MKFKVGDFATFKDPRDKDCIVIITETDPLCRRYLVAPGYANLIGQEFSCDSSNLVKIRLSKLERIIYGIK
jgi:hypothetical protein